MTEYWWTKYDYRNDPIYRASDAIKHAVERGTDTQKDILRMVVGVGEEEEILERTKRYRETQEKLKEQGVEFISVSDHEIREDPHGTLGYLNTAAMTLFMARDELAKELQRQ